MYSLTCHGKLSGTFSIKGRRFAGFRFVALSGVFGLVGLTEHMQSTV